MAKVAWRQQALVHPDLGGLALQKHEEYGPNITVATAASHLVNFIDDDNGICSACPCHRQKRESRLGSCPASCCSHEHPAVGRTGCRDQVAARPGELTDTT